MARKILLADDSVTAQNMGRRILTDAGYEVITVNNGSAALKKIAEIVPDLIVLDVYMPGYGGLEVCQRLKESPATARIPVLLTVGKLEPFKADEAKRVRADAHIIKPFDTNELLAAIIRLEDRIVAQPLPKTARPAKQGAIENLLRRGKEKSEDAGTETSSGWKRRLSVPRKPAEPVSERQEEVAASATTSAFHDIPRAENPGAPQPVPPQPEIAAETAEVEEGPRAAASFEKFGAQLASRLSSSGNADVLPEAESVSAGIPELSFAMEPPPAISTTPEAETNVASLQAPGDQSPNESEITAALASLSQTDGSFVTQRLDAVGLTESLIESGPVNPIEPDDSHAIFAKLASQPAELKVACNGPKWVAESVVLSDADSHLILEAEMEKAYAALAAAESATMAAAEARALETTEIPAANSAIETVESLAAADGASRALLETSANRSDVEAVEARATPDPDVAAVPGEVEANPQAETPSFIERISQTVAASSAIETQATTEDERVSSTAYREIAFAAAASAGSAPSENSSIEIFTAGSSSTYSEAGSAQNETSSVAPELHRSLSEPPVIAPPPAESKEPSAANPERESELAAAWQNWRQIRESIAGPQLASQITDAAAAGFRQLRKEESAEPETEIAASNRAAEEASAIAGIVDSVFAELKPKLMEEIAKKLAKERK